MDFDPLLICASLPEDEVLGADGDWFETKGAWNTSDRLRNEK